MVSERMRRRLDAFLDQAEAASDARDWNAVAEHARAALAIESDNADALTFLRMAEANLGAPTFTSAPPPEAPRAPSVEQPTSFAAGRYHVRKFLGEGGKKRVFLAHDALLDRDVAFALIKTEGLDDVGRERITREAQAMGRLGAHPHLVSIFDLGEESGAPYVVTELMAGGDVEGELERAGPSTGSGRTGLPLERALEIAKGVARGLAFAHERGIVHRDLKPGNVWLTAEGTAKIGDFGLAVAAGRSRLTQHGMMVGTFGYMPPEQALGGEATPRSDLYSLGAMLYELVTGKPPFEGDTPTAVISQHLNTPPVAPSWHTEHCPPALEDLILALLAKEPASRSASAEAVLAVLEGIDPAEHSRSHSSDSANPLDRLARGVFVGRERELERLRSALDGAFAGRGSVVMLVGEPGIGKTRTVQELETYARMRGAKVLWGRAHESSGAPPYWPWVQLGRAYREQTPDDVRRRQYEPYAVELQRIFPGLRDLFPNLPEPPPETEEGQFRLFDAFAAFARSVSTETPLVFVLDDLHWADRATLQLLAHLAREIGRARILVLGTYRDTDLDRRHPLATTLAELNREDLFTRIPLRGLGAPEVGEYVRRSAGVEPGHELVARLHEETEGNAFFLSEVVSLLTQEGTLESRSLSDVAIPEGVREALGRRLDRLSDEANELLATLAVVGREFDHALVREISQLDEDRTLALIEESLRAHVLEETGSSGEYRFAHALMQDTLADELSSARRLRLHGRAGEALEALGRFDDEASALARHFGEAALIDHSFRERALRYAGIAAQQAEERFAWDDVMRHLEKQVELLEGEQADRLRLAHAHFGLGRALSFGGSRVSALEHYTQAVDLFEELNEIGLMAEAAFWSARVGQPSALAERGLAAFRGSGTELEARLLVMLAIQGAIPTEVAHERASEIVEAAPSPAAVALVQALQIWRHEARGEWREAVAAANRAYERARASRQEHVFRMVRGFRQLAMAYAGDLAEFAEGSYEHMALTLASGNKPQYWNAVHNAAQVAFLRGELDEAARLIGLSDFPLYGSLDVFLPELRGDFEQCMRVINAATDSVSISRQQADRSRIALRLGREEESRHLLHEWLATFPLAQEPTYMELLRFTGEIQGVTPPLLEFGTRDEITAVYGFLRHGLPFCSSLAGTVHPDMGTIALRLGKADEALQIFEEGLAWARAERLPIEEGRGRMGLAEIADARGDLDAARAHLDAAGELFAKHGAKLYLDQVIAKKEILKA
jgi:tetratricopeptide (TPR) repeat protein